MTQTPDTTDYSQLSDEDFLNASFGVEPKISPDEATPAVSGTLEDRLNTPAPLVQTGEEAAVVEEEEEDDGVADDELGDKPAPAEVQAPAEGSDKDGAKPADGETPAAVAGDDPTTPHQTTPKEGEGEGEGEEGKQAPKGDGAQDFEALYKQIMSPFKANGKDFTPANPEEAVRLMQMGANYTKKMQALKPNLRMMQMLQNNGLLEEDKLAFMIDLNRKDPKAIQKLLHDSKVDPLDVDLSAEPDYTPGDHVVTDGEMEFREVLDDVLSSDTGKETVRIVNTQWDKASKDAVYAEPKLLAIIDSQRANGLFDQISAEVDRQRTLGQLTGIPFIQAYKLAGDKLHAEGKIGSNDGSVATDPAQNTARPVPNPQPLESRPATKPNKTVANGDQARAISNAPRSSQPAPKAFDPFSMTDEEILAATSPKV